MPDITMCKGEGCPVKSSCYRHEAPASEMQGYFIETPGQPGPVVEGLFGPQAEWICEFRVEVRNDPAK